MRPKRVAVLCWFAGSCVLTACRHTVPLPDAAPQSNPLPNRVPASPTAAVRPPNAVADGAAPKPDEACSRGEPTPILAIQPNGNRPTFERHGDEASERVDLDERTALTVRQFGCAHYGVEYVFLLKGEKPAGRMPADWLRRAAELFGRAAVLSDSAPALRSVGDALRRAGAHPYVYGTPLAISDAETVSLSTAEVPNGVQVVVLYDFAL